MMNSTSDSNDLLKVKGVTMPAKAFRHCIFILNELLSCYDCFQFLAPVPLTAVVYHTEIKKPMDFKTLENNLYQNKYKEYEDFAQDLCLIWDNARVFHRSFDMIYQQAENLNKRYLGLEEFIQGGPKPFYLASPQSDVESILDSLLPEERLVPYVEPTVVFPMYKELEPPNKSNLYFVQALSEQDCATKKLRGFSNVRLLFQHLNASFFEYVAKPQLRNSLPLPRFYIAKNRTLLNEAGMDPDGCLAVLYNVQIKPLNKELYQLQATVVISEPMGETHGFDESSMDKSNEYEFCPKAWLKLRVIKVVENVNTVINSDMDRSFFKKVYNTYKLSTKTPSDLKKVGSNEMANEFARSILNPVPASNPLPKETITKSTKPSIPSKSSASTSQIIVKKSTLPTQNIAVSTTQDASKDRSFASRSPGPRIAKSKGIWPTSSHSSKPTNAVSSVRSSPSKTKSASPPRIKGEPTQPSYTIDDSPADFRKEEDKTKAPPKKRLGVSHATSSTSKLDVATKEESSVIKKDDIKQKQKSTSPTKKAPKNSPPAESAELKPLIRLVLKQPRIIVHDNVDNDSEDEAMDTDDDKKESDSDSDYEDEKKDDDKKKDKEDDKKDDDGKGNFNNEDGSNGSVDDDSDGSSSPPPEAEEWYSDDDVNSVTGPRQQQEETSPIIEQYPSTTTSAQTDTLENQLTETNVSFERYMEHDEKELGGDPEKIDARKQFYINASKELWEKLRNYAKEKNVPIVDINTYTDKASSFPNAEGFFKHVYFLKHDSQKVIQTFRRMTITQRTTEIASLLALKGLPHMGQITEVLQESHGEIIGLSMQRYEKTLKQYTHAHSHHRLTAYQKMDLVIQMLECIETIHGVGLAHRDLSEVNFMVNETTELLRDGSPKAELFLIDFGKSTFTKPEDVRRWWIEHPSDLNTEYDGEVVPLTKKDLDIWCQQLPWIRSKPDHGYKLYRSVQTLPKNRTDTEGLPWLVNPLSEDLYSIGTIIWKTFSETEPWYGILDTDLKGLRETVSEDYRIESSLEREVYGTYSKELLLKFLKVSPEHRETATQVLAWLRDIKIQDALIKEWEEHAPVGRQKRHAKALFRYDDEQAAIADIPLRKKQKNATAAINSPTSTATSTSASPILIHIPPSLQQKLK